MRKVILKGDGRQGLVFVFDFHIFLGFQGLVQTFTVTAARHDPARKLIHDDHLPALDDVVHVALEERVRTQGLLHVMEHVDVARVVKILHSQKVFGPRHALLGQGHGAALFLLGVMGFRMQLRDDAVDAVVEFRRFFGRPRNDERRSCFINENAVHLIDDGIVEVSLHHLFDAELHIVAQIIKAEFIVRPVGHVGQVGFPALAIIEPVDDAPDIETQEPVNFPHPFAVAAGQVVIHRHQMHAPSGKGIEVNRHGGDQGFPFTGLHFGNGSLVQHNPADDLHIERTHPQNAKRCFPHHGESFGKQVIQRFFIGQALTEFSRLGPKLIVTQFLYGLLEGIDFIHKRDNALQVALILTAKNLLEYCTQHIG